MRALTIRTNDFEDSELFDPVAALNAAGADAVGRPFD
jgi:hypothetical protein